MSKALRHLRKAQALIEKQIYSEPWRYNALKQIEVAQEEIAHRFDTVMVKESCSTPGCRQKPTRSHQAILKPRIGVDGRRRSCTAINATCSGPLRKEEPMKTRYEHRNCGGYVTSTLNLNSIDWECERCGRITMPEAVVVVIHEGGTEDKLRIARAELRTLWQNSHPPRKPKTAEEKLRTETAIRDMWRKFVRGVEDAGFEAPDFAYKNIIKAAETMSILEERQ
jgi:hypothetical protein